MSEPADQFKRAPRRKADRGRKVSVSAETKQLYADLMQDRAKREENMPSTCRPPRASPDRSSGRTRSVSLRRRCDGEIGRLQVLECGRSGHLVVDGRYRFLGIWRWRRSRHRLLGRRRAGHDRHEDAAPGDQPGLQRLDDLGFGPGADAGFLVRREVGGIEDARIGNKPAEIRTGKIFGGIGFAREGACGVAAAAIHDGGEIFPRSTWVSALPADVRNQAEKQPSEPSISLHECPRGSAERCGGATFSLAFCVRNRAARA